MSINSGKTCLKEKRKAAFWLFLPRLVQKGLWRLHRHHCLPTVPFPASCCSALAGKGARPQLDLHLRQLQQELLWCSISPSLERELCSAELLNNQSHLRKMPGEVRIPNRCSQERYRGRDAGEEKKPQKERIKRGDPDRRKQVNMSSETGDPFSQSCREDVPTPWLPRRARLPEPPLLHLNS